MTPHDLIAAFESVTDAPDGIERLRELVLQRHFRRPVRGELRNGSVTRRCPKCLRYVGRQSRTGLDGLGGWWMARLTEVPP